VAETVRDAATEQPATPSAPGGADQGGGLMQQAFPLLILLWAVVIYLFFMRPKQKKEKDRQNKIGDKVVSIGGLHGVVTKAEEKTLTLRIDEKTGATIQIERAAVHDVPGKDQPDAS
jgi:preprotein translocase subunit YajC